MALRRMSSRYNGRCKSCGVRFKAGDEIYWSKPSGALCISCGESRKGSQESKREIPQAETPSSGIPSDKREEVKTRNVNLPSVIERGRDSYFTIDWNDLREIVKDASFNGRVPSCSIKENSAMILRHSNNEISEWHGYSVGQLQDWLVHGYNDGTIHGLGEFNPPLREKRRYVFSEDAEELIVDRALSGDDNFMAGYTPKENIPGVAVEIEIMFASSVSAEIVNAWNRFICRSMLTLETAGIDAQITLKFTSGDAASDGKTLHSIVRVKKENEAVDFQSFSAMLSPAALRTFGFASLVLHAEQRSKAVAYGIGHGHTGSEWAIRWNAERRILEFNCPYIPRGKFPEDEMVAQLRVALQSMKSG